VDLQLVDRPVETPEGRDGAVLAVDVRWLHQLVVGTDA